MKRTRSPMLTNWFGKFVVALVLGTAILSSPLVAHGAVQMTQITFGNDDSFKALLSGDGRFLVFASRATNLGPVDTNGRTDVYVKDMVTNNVELVSVANGTHEQGNGESYAPSISADGRYVVYYSQATNLIPGQTLGSNAYLYDRQTGTTELVSVSSSGAPLGAYWVPYVSENGQYVAFTSSATQGQVYVRDRVNQVTTQISIYNGRPADAGAGVSSMSADGRYVAWSSSSLFGGSSNLSRVYVWDRLTGQSFVEYAYQSEPAGGGILSTSGRYMVYTSTASSGLGQYYLYDVQNRSRSYINTPYPGSGATTYSARGVSNDGRYIVYQSDSYSLYETDGFYDPDIFVWDNTLRSLLCVSDCKSTRGVGDRYSYDGVMNADATYVSYHAEPQGGSGNLDVFRTKVFPTSGYILIYAGTLAVTEGTQNATYSVGMTGAPTADVTIALTAGTQLQVSPSTLTFTTANWMDRQTVTVSAVDNGIAQGDHASSITHQVTSADTRYNNATLAPVSVMISDPDIQSPTISITSPASDAVVRGVTPVTVSATDNRRVMKVDFFLDGAPAATEGAPFSWNWDTRILPDGSTHTVEARAYDAAGNVAVSNSVTVQVDNTPPAISITQPAPASTVIGTVAVTANANDPYGIDKVMVYLDNTLKSTITQAPYVWNWNTTTATNGAHTLKAEAYDRAGNVTTTPTISVVVDLPPTISLSVPAAVRGTQTLSATATDTVGVTRVEFYLDDTLQFADTSSPYAWSWDSTTTTNGDHQVYAKAYDAAGNVTATNPASTTVDNAAPSVSILTPADAATVIGTAAVSADANDNRGVTKVEFYLDGALKSSDTVAPYTWDWVTTTATNGPHTLTAKAYDAVGNVGTSTAVAVTVDLPPTVSVTAPTGGSVVKGTVTATASAADTVGVTQVEFCLDGALQGTASTAPYTWAWDTTAASNAGHSLTAKAYDAAGNVTTSSAVSVTVDNAAPTVNITAPTEGATVIGTVSVTATAMDNRSVTTVEFYLDDVLKSSDTTTPYSWNWATTTATNGVHSIAVKAYDSVGNVSTDTKSVTVDLPPTASIASPPAGSLLRGTATITASATDLVGVTSVEFLVDSVLKSTVTEAPYTWDWDTTQSTNASHTVLVKAYDAAGNASSASAAYTVDNSLPTVSLTAPAAGASLKGVVTVSATATDNAAVAKVEFYADDVLQSTDTATPFSWSWTTTTATNGDHTLVAKAYDTAGNLKATAPITVTVDNLAPTVSLTAPAPATTVTGTVMVTADAGDNAAVTKVDFYLDGVLKSTVTAAPYFWNWTTTTATNGAHTLRATAYDAAGNATNSANVAVTVDLPPTVSISAPAANASIRSTVSVTATAADTVGVSRVEFYLDGALQSTDTTSPYAWSWNTTAVVNGPYTLTAKAFDAVSNETTSAGVSVTVDNEAPVTAITVPADGATVIDTVGVTATAADNRAVTKVEFYLDGTLKSTVTTAPYLWSWVTTTATNGAHTLLVKAFDAAGNIGTTQANVTVDLPPTVSITAPAASAIIRNSVNVTASATDAVGVTQVEFYLDGALQSTVAAAPYAWVWDTSTATNANHTLTAKAYDAVGNVKTSTGVTVTVDNAPPTLSITVPTDGATVINTVAVTASASDNRAVTKVEIYLDGTLKATVTTAPYTWSWVTTTATDGPHEVSAKAYDAAGNVTTAAANVTVDLPPTVSIVSPTSGSLVRGLTTVTGNATDLVGVTRVEFLLDSVVKCTLTAAPYTWEWDTATATNASHTVSLKAYDAAGNVKTANAAYTVDNAAPTVSLTAPAAGAAVRSTVTVNANSTDNVAVARVEFYLDDVLQATDTATPYSWSWSSTTAADGDHALMAKAYDTAGNSATTTATTVIVDNSLPVANLAAPAAGATVTGTVPVTADASDNRGVTKVNFYLDGVLQTTVTAEPYVWNWVTTTATNGSHILRATAYDAAGNTGNSANVTVTVDLPPTVSVSAASVVRSTATVTATATDTVGVTKVEFYLDGTLQSTDTTSPYNWPWDTTTVVNGAYTLTAMAYDAADNVTTSAGRSVTVDNEVPVVAMTTPSDGGTVIGTVNVAATATDNRGVTKVEFYLDGALQSTVTTAPYTWSWVTTSATNGAHALSVKAYDAAGNIGNASANVTVDLPPTVSFTAPAANAVVTGNVVVAANAADAVGVTQVEFYLDGALQNTVTTAPYSWNWDTTLASNASHTLMVKAYDASGNVTSASRACTVDNSAPSVSVTAPANGATVIGTVSVTATATDNRGVTTVEFYLDDVLKATDTATPYSWSWVTTTATNGVHTISAKAYDGAGNISVATINVTVDLPPTISITAPPAGLARGTQTVTADAADAVGVTKVDFYLDGTLKSTATVAPYTWSWDTTLSTNASHTVLARAYDAAGNSTSTSRAFTVDNQAPTVSLSAPANGATVTGTVTVSATASDNQGVARVEFSVDGVVQTSDATSPYSWSWVTSTAGNGSHVLTATAYDNAGNVTTSTARTVTVNN